VDAASEDSRTRPRPAHGLGVPPRSTFTRVWLWAYEQFYAAFRGIVALLFRPLFLLRRVGEPPRLPRGGVILCPNHQSYLDPAFVQLTLRRRVTFVMTHSFYRLLPAKVFFMLVGAIPVGAGRTSWGGMRRAAAILRRGGALVVFPEGRLSRDGTLQRAQRGVAGLARRGRAPVVPVAIEGSLRAWPKGARWLRRSDVRVAFGRPLAPPGPATREGDQAFADRVMEAIAALRPRAARGLPAARANGGRTTVS
jgi:1-acyl-sn-glycerol-3-phosphate acyltransferase